MALSLNLSDEYTVIFEAEPFGMTWASRKSDRKNLYVTKIDPDSPAFFKNVIKGSKLIAFEDEMMENLGAKEIFWHFKNTYHDVLPLKIKFRKPPETTDSPITRGMSVYQQFSPNTSEIKLPVDCGDNAMKYTSPERLQDNFIAVLEYMAKAQNTPTEWITFLSANDFEVLTRFAKTSKRLLDAEIADSDQDEKEKEENTSSAFGWLCAILLMFGNLDITNFVDIITEYSLRNIIISLKQHDMLSRQDIVNRMDVINWIILHNNKLGEYIDDAFIKNICGILNDNKYNDVIQMSSKSLIYGTARKHKAEIKDALVSIQNTLTDDSFRHFTEYYFDLLNNIDYNDDNNKSSDELELLIEFNAFVFRYNLYTFYFTSDIKILIDIYIRSYHNCEPSSKQLLLCLDGLYNIIRWKNYSNIDGLDKYKLNELLDIISNELKKTVSESYNEYQKQYKHYADLEDKKYSKTEINDILRLIELINKKLNTIIDTLKAINEGKYDYEKKEDIQLPIDISDYALKTKSMKQIQSDLSELLYFLSQNMNTPQEWITFLSNNEYEVYKRLCTLVIRLLQNETKYIKSIGKSNDEKKTDDVIDVGMEAYVDGTELFPLTTLCQLLTMFATLDPAKFIKTIKVRVLNPLRASLKYADKLKAQDVVIRLKVLFFMINNDDTLQIAFEWFLVLCNLLTKRDDDSDGDILLMSTKCITFFIGKMNDQKKQKEFLLHLQNKLKNADDFRDFVQVYVKLINEIRITKWNDATTKLLINFVVCVMQQQMNEFFYVSDIKILIEIYERCTRNIDIEMDKTGFIICLNGIKALMQWNSYNDENEKSLYKYRYDEITSELKGKSEIATQQNMNDVVDIINQILNINL